MRPPLMARGTWIAAGVALAATIGCRDMLDQNRHQPSPQPRRRTATMPTTMPTTMSTTMPTTMSTTMPTTMPTTVATGDLGQVPPLTGMTPPPKPFVAIGRHAPPPAPAQPSPLLVEHASLDSPFPLSAYGSQPIHSVADFQLGPHLTGIGLQKRLGPPAGLAGVEDRWYVYRLTHNRELWLNFAGGDGPLLAADVIHGAENGYVRDRLYPQ